MIIHHLDLHLVPGDPVLERPEIVPDVHAALVITPIDLALLAPAARVLPREPRPGRWPPIGSVLARR